MARDTEKRVQAKFIIDSTGFNKGLGDINRQLKLTQSELQASNAKVGVFGNNIDKLKVTSESLTRQISLQNEKVKTYKDVIQATTEKLQGNIKAKDELKKKITETSAKYQEAIKLYGKESEEAQKAKSEVDKLTDEYKKKEKAVESNTKQIDNYTINLNKAEAELAKMQGELQKTNKELAKSSNGWIQSSETLKKASEKLKKTGSVISGAGDKILKLTAPLVGAGIASLKFANDFENSMAKVSTISVESEVSIKDLRKQIIKLSDDTGIAATEIANNVYDAISAGQKTGDAVNFVANSTKLAKAGFAQAADSLDILTTIMNAYKLKAEEVGRVSDILIQVQNKGKVTVGELSSVMGKVIPTAVATNTSLEQLGAGYALMTANGIKAAESTTYMNSMLNELSKTGTKADKALREMTGKSFSDLMKEGKNLSDILNLLNDYAKKNKLSLKDMFGSAEAGKAALVLATNAGEDFNGMLKDMNNSIGSTDEAFKKVTNTRGERFAKSLNKLRNEAIRFGDTIAPIMDSLSNGISKLADKLGKLDEKQLQAIAKVGMLAVGLGGVLKVGGGLISTVGNIAGGLSKLTGAFGTATMATKGTTAVVGLATKGFSMAGLAAKAGALLLNPWTLGIGAAALAGVGIAKALKTEVVPAVNLFNDKVEYSVTPINNALNAYYGYGQNVEVTTIKISEATKKTVGAYIEMDNGVKNTLTDLYINSTAITEQNKNELIGKYQQMGETINSNLQIKRDENVKSLQEFFAKSKAITDAEETDILKKTDVYYNGKKKIIDDYQKQIKDILDKASKEHRAITEEESKTILGLQNKMKEESIKILSENELEAKVILERMKGYDTRITAEQTSQHIKKLNEGRDKAVKAANEEYEKRIATIIKMRDEAKVISAEQADVLIADATRQKDGIIQKAEETRIEAIKKMSDMNTDLESQVDTTTGKILTWWDKIKRWWSGWQPETKTFTINQVTTTTTSNTSPYLAPQYQYGGYKVNVRPGSNASGTNSWRGGLTSLHEKGYELYDLPNRTRIYNHEASEDLVMKTAETVARKIVGNNGNNKAGVNVTQNIYAPVPTPSEISRQSKRELQKLALSW